MIDVVMLPPINFILAFSDRLTIAVYVIRFAFSLTEKSLYESFVENNHDSKLSMWRNSQDANF